MHRPETETGVVRKGDVGSSTDGTEYSDPTPTPQCVWRTVKITEDPNGERKQPTKGRYTIYEGVTHDPGVTLPR